MCARQRDADSGLDDSVALRYATQRLIVVSAIQRVRDGADEQLGRVARQYRIRIEGYDVANELQPARITDDCRECVAGVATQIFVELGELAALALPTHPHVLFWIPQSRAMKEKKHILISRPVLAIERFDAVCRCRQDFVVTGT